MKSVNRQRYYEYKQNGDTMDAELMKLYTSGEALADSMYHYIRLIREQNISESPSIFTELLDYFDSFLNDLERNRKFLSVRGLEIHRDQVNGMLTQLVSHQEKSKFSEMADDLQISWLPFLQQIRHCVIDGQEHDSTLTEVMNRDDWDALKKNDKKLYDTVRSSDIDKKLGAEYMIEHCALMGQSLSVKRENESFYLTSQYMSVSEARDLSSTWYSGNKTEYLLYGIGAGYHIQELFRCSDYIRLTVYENDPDIIALYVKYFSYKRVKTRCRIIYDPTLDKFWEAVRKSDDNTGICIHYPSIKNIGDWNRRQRMYEFFTNQNAEKIQRGFLNANFKANIKNFDGFIGEIENDFKNKDLFLIAAGPSLDKNIRQLREIKKSNPDAVMLSIGAVFKKLLKENILPDYVIFTDAKPVSYGQISGAEAEKIPLIGLSTMNQDIAKNYSGKKYLLCQNGYKPAEQYAKEHNSFCVNTGSSVSTTAIDLGIQLGCARIICLGLDLAYPDNKAHCQDGGAGSISFGQDAIQTEDVYGKMVYTSRSLDMFRKWIERRIEGEKNTVFIDATEGGAKIKGMKICTLEECI